MLDRDALLDIPAAQARLRLVAATEARGLNTFSLPFEAATAGTSELGGRAVVVFSSYSYLGLARHPAVIAATTAAVERYGSSTGGVRLMTGTLDIHVALERELAAFVGQPASATFTSGYAANLAALGSLFGPEDLVLLDRFAHASLVAGARLAGAQLDSFGHNDVDALERKLIEARDAAMPPRRILVVVDGVFSMDGDAAPLAALIELKRAYGAFLLVDDSHAIAAVGPRGRGSAEDQGVNPHDIDLVTGALSKGIPSTGGFVASSAAVCSYIRYGSAPFIFSAAGSPATVAATRAALALIQSEPEHLERLRHNTARLRSGLADMGFALAPGTSPIVPLLLGDFGRACQWSAWLLDRGVCTSAVGHPAVPHGRARLRLCATAAHTDEQFERLFDGLAHCQRSERVLGGPEGQTPCR